MRVNPVTQAACHVTLVILSSGAGPLVEFLAQRVTDSEAKLSLDKFLLSQVSTTLSLATKAIHINICTYQTPSLGGPRGFQGSESQTPSPTPCINHLYADDCHDARLLFGRPTCRQATPRGKTLNPKYLLEIKGPFNPRLCHPSSIPINPEPSVPGQSLPIASHSFIVPD